MEGSSVTVSALCPGGIMTNEECRRLIAAQGFIGRISCHHPEEVARYAVGQLLRGRAIIIPGLINKITRILSGAVPLPLIQRFIRSRFGSSRQPDERESASPIMVIHHG
jgi:short-subunit dehydrogenase